MFTIMVSVERLSSTTRQVQFLWFKASPSGKRWQAEQVFPVLPANMIYYHQNAVKSQKFPNQWESRRSDKQFFSLIQKQSTKPGESHSHTPNPPPGGRS
jgi:hypothetical protein